MKFRWRVFFIHISISCSLAILLLFLVFGFWYPSPMDVATGVTSVFIVVLICDLILGPVLTFIIANPEKRHLKWDIGGVIFIQLLALSYGLWIVEQGRPAWLVFAVDRFDLVQVYELNTPYRDVAQKQYRTRNWLGPQWVYARPPDNIEDRNKLTFEALMAGVDIPQRPDLYLPLEEGFEVIIQKSQPLSKLNMFNSTDQVIRILELYPAATDFLPMMSRAKPMTVLIDRNAKKIVAIVDLVPWE